MKLNRNAAGKLARHYGHIRGGPEGTPCCCIPPAWIPLFQCATDRDTDGQAWFCSHFDPVTWTACKWISLRRFLELNDQAVADIADEEISGSGLYNIRVYESESNACFYDGPFSVESRTPPGIVVDDTVDYSGWVPEVNSIGSRGCCAEPPGSAPQDPRCDCDDDDDTKPPDDNPNPDPDPDPDCVRCGERDVCEFCTCTPAYGIRVAISGTTNCTCTGPCGNGPSYRFSRVQSGYSINAVFDLLRVGSTGTDACTWRTVTLLILETGTPSDTSCVPGGTSVAATLELRRLGASSWAFSIYVHDMNPADPRLFDNTSDSENWRFFSGSSANGCMTPGTMTNEITACSCHDTATSDGRFDLCYGGTASFTVLCP